MKRTGEQRFICFDFSDNLSLEPGVTPPFTGEVCGDPIWNTTSHDNDPDGWLGIAENTSIMANSRFIFQTDGQFQYWVRFGAGPGSDRVRITRTETDTYVLEGSARAEHRQQRLKGND